MTKRQTPEQKHVKRLEKLKKWGLVGTKKRTAAEFQRMIRLEAADANGLVACVTCGFSNKWTNPEGRMDAGHFVSGRSNAVLFVEDNCHPQCVHCNRYLSGNQESYTDYMIGRYGADRVHELRVLRGQVLKFTALELDEMRLEYRRRVKIVEKRLTLLD